MYFEYLMLFCAKKIYIDLELLSRGEMFFPFQEPGYFYGTWKHKRQSKIICTLHILLWSSHTEADSAREKHRQKHSYVCWLISTNTVTYCFPFISNNAEILLAKLLKKRKVIKHDGWCKKKKKLIQFHYKNIKPKQNQARLLRNVDFQHWPSGVYSHLWH